MCDTMKTTKSAKLKTTLDVSPENHKPRWNFGGAFTNRTVHLKKVDGNRRFLLTAPRRNFDGGFNNLAAHLQKSDGERRGFGQCLAWMAEGVCFGGFPCFFSCVVPFVFPGGVYIRLPVAADGKEMHTSGFRLGQHTPPHQHGGQPRITMWPWCFKFPHKLQRWDIF